MKKTSLKEIIDTFEEKILVRYRFDKGAVKNKTTCLHCIFFENNYCNFLKDKVDQKYTCDKFIKRDK